MRWLFQKTGLINQYKEKIHTGVQPIRVLHHMNLYMFQNATPDFITELKKAIDSQKIEPRVNIVYGESPITHGPYIDGKTRTIFLDETFLSYLWCICHSVYTLYIQQFDYPRLNNKIGQIKYEISQKLIDDAQELFAYAKSLIKAYSKWEIDRLPNPESYMAEVRNFIEQPNIFFTEAVKFILLHEYIHAIKHLDQLMNQEQPISNYLEFEKEADAEAIKLQKLGIFETKINELAIHVGITLGILSMFYFASTTDGGAKHPDKEDRLVNALQQLELTDDSPCWGIALVGLQLWAEQFNLEYAWDQKMSDKEAFDHFISQIKENK